MRAAAQRAKQYEHVLREASFDPDAPDAGARLASAPLRPSAMRGVRSSDSRAASDRGATRERAHARGPGAEAGRGVRTLRDAILENDIETLTRLAHAPQKAELDAASLDLLATVLARTQLDLSIRVLEYGHARFPRSFPLAFEAGARLAQKDWSGQGRAIPYFTAALALRPESVEVRRRLAAAWRSEDQEDRAAALLRDALTRAPRDADLHARLAIILRRTDPETARRHVDRALALDGSEPLAHTAAGLMETSLDDRARHFDRALECDPNHLLACLNLGQIRMRQGRYREALAFHRKTHAIGGHWPSWPYPSAWWIEWCERLARLEPLLPEVVAGRSPPLDGDEWFAMAHLSERAGHVVTTARCWQRYVEDVDETELRQHKGMHVEAAARAAAAAGIGAGAEGARLDPAARRAWRDRALRWLQDDWNWLQSHILSVQAESVRARCRRWFRVREIVFADPSPLGPDERGAWTAFSRASKLSSTDPRKKSELVARNTAFAGRRARTNPTNGAADASVLTFGGSRRQS